MEPGDLRSRTTLCSKRDCCPVAEVFEDGSLVLVDNDGPLPIRIVLDPEQAALLKLVLDKA